MTQINSTPFYRKYIGDRQFYKMVLGLSVPIMIQNGITNFVSLLDNIMIGRIGTEQMSGAAIVNQLLFVYYLCIFGGVSGAGIFTAQYFGQKDQEGIRHTVRFKFWICLILTGGAMLLFLLAGPALISYYLRGDGEAAKAAATLGYAGGYLRIMLLGLPAVMVVNIYSSTLRECGETMIPMRASVSAVLLNLVFNYLLIYGKFGFPELGVRGAAIATVMSRYLELAIVTGWTHTHKEQFPFAKGLYRTLRVPGLLARKFFIKGIPLLVNETLWGAGIAMLSQCYSVRGLHVVAATNISNTLYSLFNVVYIALGDSVAIVVGQLLGAGKMEEARDTDRKMITFSVLACLGVAVLMVFAAPYFPRLYNTEEEARTLARWLITITAITMPHNAFLHATYFTLRSGGRTIITFLFDSVFVWCVSVPVAYVLSRYTGFSILVIYSLVQAADLIKCVIGYILVHKGVWLNNIVS